ncbi:hypothetical protein BU14_0749s0007 [Porphyra umbilicalis]|uniref:Uncharacterized protein n=1 Tax=Porphyra umbilicalis TaxID=2786 RepID=A0A1X6NPE4_PORUM|nr:hypothetical protein BU14_0749s0007 [Porphyra umbilicalis]|eukprot:OSX70452.1 hypothetical protein BU14_0749s0007 [Porphyra umbilicalis]
MGVPEATPYPTTVPQLVRRGHTAAATDADATTVAFISDATGRSLTYAALWARVAAAAAGLTAAGVRRGDVIGVAGPSGLDAPVLILAAGAVGAAVAPVYTAAPAPEWHRMVGPLRPVAVAGGRDAVGMLRSIAADLAAATGKDVAVLVLDGDEVADAGAGAPTDGAPPAEGDGATPAPATVRELSFAALIAAAAPTVDVEAVLACPGVTADDTLLLPASSGTTGPPKVVRITHHAFVACVQSMAPHGIVPLGGSVVAAPFPMYHIAGALVYAAIVPYMRATAVVLSPGGGGVPGILATTARHRVSMLILFPPLLAALAVHPAVPAADVSSLDAVWVGGAPTSAATEMAVATRLGVPVGQLYGSTEGLMAAGSTWPDRMNAYPGQASAVARGGSVGIPADGVEVRIVATTAPHDDVPPGGAGELLFRSDQTMVGYVDNPGATAAAMDGGGWLHTGDLARRDPASGAVWVLDRLTDTIGVGAFNVSPVEVEAVLRAAPGVADVAVVGAPHDQLRFVPHAFVIRTAGGGGRLPTGRASSAPPPTRCGRGQRPSWRPTSARRA